MEQVYLLSLASNHLEIFNQCFEPLIYVKNSCQDQSVSGLKQMGSLRCNMRSLIKKICVGKVREINKGWYNLHGLAVLVEGEID